MRKRFELRLGRKDRDRLELIKAVYGVSMADAIRIALRSVCERLGIDKKTGDVLEKY